jgi:hypothetical protein
VLALALLMVTAGAVVHLFRRHRVGVDEASGESLPGVRNRMLVSLRGGGGELGNLKP